jgi:hypothetical protein
VSDDPPPRPNPRYSGPIKRMAPEEES